MHTNNEGMKFKVGDRVRVLDGSKIRNYIGGWVYDMEKHIGKVDTIIGVGLKTSEANGYYLKDSGGYFFDGRGLELVANNKIVITTDGKTTLARLYDGGNVIKSAEAKCSPDDEFDFSTGAKIAFERLTADSYDYDAACEFFKSLCYGETCDECYLRKCARKHKKGTCMDVISIGSIRDKKYAPAYLEKIKAEIEKMQEEDKKADETAIKIIGATYEVIGNSRIKHRYRIGERIKLVFDDGTNKPQFSNDKGMKNWVAMQDVKLVENPSKDGAYFNGKAVYLETELTKWSILYNLTKGNVYTFVDGNFTDDNGEECSARFSESGLKDQGFVAIKE